ncbi:MAG: MATE family multidrug resistance protein, partial [Candidatus Azotimanducaceae bacterium]
NTSLYRAMMMGASIGLVLLCFQVPLALLSLELFGASQEVEDHAKQYFDIRIWTAPISLMHLAIIGYLIGIQKTRAVLIIQLVLNGSNILLDLIFVNLLGWGIPGVAFATVISEFLAFGLGIFIVSKKLNLTFSPATLFNAEKLKTMILVNRDIMVRTLCLIFAFAWFTNQGAKYGDVTLAANAILLHLVSLSAFFLDGFALAAETLVGAAVGEKNRSTLHQIIKLCTELAVLTAISLSLAFWLMGSWIISLMSNVDLVLIEAEEYLIWVILAPIVSVWCYLLDGIFIGATRTAEMRNAMIISLLGFIAIWYVGEIILWESARNHGLWGSLLAYFILRALALNYYLPRLKSLN